MDTKCLQIASSLLQGMPSAFLAMMHRTQGRGIAENGFEALAHRHVLPVPSELKGRGKLQHRNKIRDLKQAPRLPDLATP